MDLNATRIDGAENAIPLVIHQMWYDRDPMVKDNEGPPLERYPRYAAYMASWRRHNPEFAYVFWNRRRIEEGLWGHPLLARWRRFFFHGLTTHMARCDFSRYALLYVYGGVYVDLDFECLRPIAPLLRGRNFGWALEPREHAPLRYWARRAAAWLRLPGPSGPERAPDYIANGFLMSAPHHWVWPLLMDWVMARYQHQRGVLDATGTACLAAFAREHRLLALHPELFVDTCLVLPLTKRGAIAAGCPADSIAPAGRSAPAAYCCTHWKDGTYWWLREQSHSLSLMCGVAVAAVVVVVVLAVVFATAASTAARPAARRA
jgi:hypothetical protein